MVKVKATFTGTNSLGYKNGQEYLLLIYRHHIVRPDGTGRCEYESISSFLENWNNIYYL